MADSPANSLNPHDWMRVLEILVQVGAAAVIAKVLALIPGMDFGTYSPIVMAVSVPLLEAAKRYVQGPSPTI